MSVVSFLKSAIETGEILRISYGAGSQPGAIRDIRPVSIKGDMLRARDDFSSGLKNYKIALIEIVPLHKPLTYYPRARRPMREIKIEALAGAWYFSIDVPVFAQPLDLIQVAHDSLTASSDATPRRQMWMIGDPPLLTLAAGDTFYSQAQVCKLPWGAVDSFVALQIAAAEKLALDMVAMSFAGHYMSDREVVYGFSSVDFIEILQFGPESNKWPFSSIGR